MKTVGILGGGQLGLLLANSIAKLGGRSYIYDPDLSAPARYHSRQSISRPWTDYKALEGFFESVDVVTYEFENVDTTELSALNNSKSIYPSLNILEIAQDRIREKQFIRDNDLPTVSFEVAYSPEELLSVTEKLDFPFIVKTARGGYDGKGQREVSDEADLKQAAEELFKGKSSAVVIEEKIDLAGEVSCIVARDRNKKSITFPVLENEHRDHILYTTVLPSRLPQSVQRKVEEIALAAAERLELCGLLTTEFFLSNSPGRNGTGIECDGWFIFINEFAPRPHNSGHITMNACSLSQFDALARVLLDIPLTKPVMNSSGAFCMMNLLGDIWIKQGAIPSAPALNLEALADHTDIVDVVIYGKCEAREKRKMGHIVSYADNVENALAKAKDFETALIGVTATA